MKTLLLLVLTVLLSACEKPSQSPVKHEDLPPNTSFVLLNKEGVELITSRATPLRVSSFTPGGRYFELGDECAGGYCHMIGEFPPNAYHPYNFLYSSGGLTSSSVIGCAYWYLTLNGKTDTLYFNLQGVDPEHLVPAHPTFNGQPIAIDPNLNIPAYVLRRRH